MLTNEVPLHLPSLLVGNKNNLVRFHFIKYFIALHRLTEWHDRLRHKAIAEISGHAINLAFEAPSVGLTSTSAASFPVVRELQ